MLNKKLLTLVIKQVSQNEKKLTKEFADIHQYLNKQKQQLEQLVQYHTEYSQSLQSQISASFFQNFQAFVEKLKFTIQEQKQVIIDLEQKLHAKEADVEKQRRKLEQLQNANDNIKVAELKSLLKKEQNQNDEMAIGRYFFYGNG